MNILTFLTGTAILVDRDMGLSVTSLLGSLGAAGAALTATHYFIGFLKSQENDQARIVEDFRDYHAESQKTFQDQLDRLSNRQLKNQHDFQKQIAQMSESQNVILRDAIGTISRMENLIDGSSARVHGMQERIGSLRLKVGAIDVILCDAARK